MRQSVEKVTHNHALLAIIIRSDYGKEGIEFFTPNDFSRQLAYMNRPAEYNIDIAIEVGSKYFRSVRVMHSDPETRKLLVFDK